LRADARAERIPFRAAWRQLKTIPTLRRSWAAGFALGAGVVPIAVMFNFFFEKEYGIESNTARGAITTLYAIGSLVGLRAGSKYSTKALMAGDLPRLTVYAAIALAVLAVAFLGMALAPWLAVSVMFVFLLGTAACINSFGLPILAAVSPPRLRSQALGYFVFSIGLGAAFVTPVVSSLGEEVSYRLAISLLSIVMLIAAAVFVSVRHQVREDADRAFAAFREEAI
jgi:MFS family permease